MKNNTIEVKQVFTQEILQSLPLLNEQEVDAQLAIAHQHRKSPLPIHKRLSILLKMAELMQAEHASLASLVANESGKPLKDARVEVTRAIDGVTLAFAELRAMHGTEVPMDHSAAGAGRLAFTIQEPIGVVIAVSAFNHPLNLTVHQAVPAIAAGAPVIFKPSSTTPLSALRLRDMALAAGLPEEYFQIAIVDNTMATKLVTDSRVNFLSFIGSAKVGWMLRSNLTPGARFALEHGGVAPVILDEYADIEGFVNGMAKASFYHAGQVCISVQKIFVKRAMARDVAQRIDTAGKKMVIGNSAHEETDIGPLIFAKEAERVAAWVDEAIAGGAECIGGGNRIGEKCYETTVLLNPPVDAKVSTQEIFGPVVCVYEYDDINEAIAAAGSLDVAFQASIFTNNISTALNTAKALDASAVMVNDYTTFRVDWMPFAGRRHSGFGIGGIGQTMHDMSEHKLIVLKP